VTGTVIRGAAGIVIIEVAGIVTRIVQAMA
jgi:hypothetical protein